MKERAAGFILMCAIVPLAILGYFIVVITGMFGKVKRARQGVRALDHFVNASVFNGYAWESVSSHAWRVKDEKEWAKFIIWLTDKFHKDHCKKANKREQKVVNLILKYKLNKQTIGKEVII
jgi:hypothetical protein